MQLVLFSEIAFIFRQIYPQSRSHARFVLVASINRSKPNSNQSKNAKRTKTTTGFIVDRIKRVRESVEYPNFHSILLLVSIFIIFKRHAENPLFTTCSSTSHTKSPRFLRFARIFTPDIYPRPACMWIEVHVENFKPVLHAQPNAVNKHVAFFV